MRGKRTPPAYLVCILCVFSVVVNGPPRAWLWFLDVVTRPLSRNSVGDLTACCHLWWKKPQKMWLHNPVNILKNVEVHTTRMNCMICELCLNKAVRKKVPENRQAHSFNSEEREFRKSQRRHIIQLCAHHLHGMVCLVYDLILAERSLSWTKGIAFWTRNILFQVFPWGKMSLGGGLIFKNH